MSQLLTPASLDDLLKERPPPTKKSSEFTKTQKNYSGLSSSSNEKVSTVLKSMQEMDDDDATTYLGNFNPPPAPSSAGVQRTVDKEHFVNSSIGKKHEKPEPFSLPPHGGVSHSSSGQSYELNKLQYAYHPPQVVDNYYQQVVPNYKVGSLPKLFAATSPDASKALQNPLKEGIAALSEYGAGVGGGCSGASDGMLVEKLNYMIHLLEEKQDVKTNSTIEEIIMYCFLGIFIIFIVDSFSRVGKYVR
jgi:hypothetical protein